MRVTKKLLTAAAAAAMSAMMSMTAFAAMGSWQQDGTGWWWQRSGGSYPTNQWVWIDGNSDGTAECYYFGPDGYMYADTTTPDGYTVNADGAWTVDGAVQKQQTHSEIHDVQESVTATAAQNTDGAVMDGYSIEKIELNWELADMMGVPGSLDRFTDKTVLEQGAYGPTYSATYNGQTIRIESVSEKNYVNNFYGPASAFFKNFPTQGIETNAFYDNTGYESMSAGRQMMASTGDTDQVFGLPTGSYRMAWGNAQGTTYMYHFMILLTKGADRKYYIFPDSPMTLY